MTLSDPFEQWLFTLFDLNEWMCFSEDIYWTALTRYPDRDTDLFFSINPMKFLSTRADANVTVFRNILIEIDNLPLNQQIDYVKSFVPVTSIVYSGGKSYHFIISLAEPCSTKEEYDSLVKRVYALMPAVDKSTKNASRFSRLPGLVRPDTGKKQELIYSGSRIPRATLEAVLPPPEAPKADYTQPKGFYSTLVVDSMFYPDTVMRKIGIESRNQYFFWLGQRLKEAATPPENARNIIDSAYNALKNKTDFPLTEARLAARVSK